MRLFALAGLCIAAATTIGCAGSRAYSLYPSASPLEDSVYGVNPAQVSDPQADDHMAVAFEEAPAAPAFVRSAPAEYTRRTTLRSPPPPPPPALSGAYRTNSYRGTPVRTASTVRAPTRTLAARPAPMARPVAAPAAPIYVAPRCAPPRYVAPRVRKSVRRFVSTSPLSLPCSGGT